MRQFFRLCIVMLVLFYSCSEEKEQSKKIFAPVPPFYIKATIDSTVHCDSSICYYVTATLENKTLLHLRYYSWTCSWTENFVTDNRNVEVKQNICFSNWYFIDSIPPLGKKTFPLIIRNVSRQQNAAFKIGFSFLDPAVVSPGQLLQFTPNERLKNSTWSNPVSTVR